MEYFEEVCNAHEVWIIKYHPISTPNPIYLVWYSSNDTEKLMTYNTGKIFCTLYLDNIFDIINKNIIILDEPDRFKEWLIDISQLQPKENSVYDMFSIVNNLKNNNFDLYTSESLVNFINLAEDYAIQIKSNENLNKSIKNKIIKKIWNHYYNFIFWPKFENKGTFDRSTVPHLNVKIDKILIAVLSLISSFEINIMIEPPK